VQGADSNLPSWLFDTCDADVEERIGGAAGAFLLQQLATGTFERPDDLPRLVPPEPDSRDVQRDPPVDAAEIDAFVRAQANKAVSESPEPPPPLDEGEFIERIWVLADLAATANGVARQRATLTLREVMKSIDSPDADLAVLAHLSADIEAALASDLCGSPNMLLRVLGMIVRRGLERCTR
jgi:hypothetical protein